MSDDEFYKVFITDQHRYGLFDKQNHLRAVSYDIDGVVMARKKWKWPSEDCSIKRIKLLDSCLKFGEVIQ